MCHRYRYLYLLFCLSPFSISIPFSLRVGQKLTFAFQLESYWWWWRREKKRLSSQLRGKNDHRLTSESKDPVTRQSPSNWSARTAFLWCLKLPTRLPDPNSHTDTVRSANTQKAKANAKAKTTFQQKKSFLEREAIWYRARYGMGQLLYVCSLSSSSSYDDDMTCVAAGYLLRQTLFSFHQSLGPRSTSCVHSMYTDSCGYLGGPKP